MQFSADNPGREHGRTSLRGPAPLPALLTPVLISAACGGASDATDHPPAIVRDSAGIEIVESPAPSWDRGEGWTVEAEPFLEIGAAEGEAEDLLGAVRGVVVLPDGGVVVANGADHTIRYYDSDGAFITRAGGHGEGPREFSQLYGLTSSGSEIWGIQPEGRPSRVFDPDGRFLHSVDPPTIAPDPRRPWRSAYFAGVFEDGSVLVSLQRDASPAPGETGVHARVVGRGTPGRPADTLRVLPARRAVGWERGSLSQEYGPVGHLAAGPRSFYYGWSEEPEVTVFDLDGEPRRILRWSAAAIPVTGEHRAYYRDDLVSPGAPPAMVEQWNAMVDAMIFPEHHPFYQDMMVDREGRVWLQRTREPEPPPDATPRPTAVAAPDSDAPTTWDVFDAGGLWLGPLELPPRFVPHTIGDDWIAGVWWNELDVEHVRLYRIDRGAR